MNRRSLSLPSLRHGLALMIALAVPTLCPFRLSAQPSGAGQATPEQAPLEYKMLTGFKQPFNDDLQLHLSKGWKPVGGVSVTVWNNDLYFAQLLGRPVAR